MIVYVIQNHRDENEGLFNLKLRRKTKPIIIASWYHVTAKIYLIEPKPKLTKSC